MKDLWLPYGHIFPDGSKATSLLYSGIDWQIYATDGSDNVLIVRTDLAQKWCDLNFLVESQLDALFFDTVSYKLLFSHKKYLLLPVENMKSAHSKVDALAFSLSLKESRKIINDVSFHDAIYVEQFSRLLPTWTMSPYVEDQVVLGMWLTGGVVISTDSFRRLSNLTGWMPTIDLIEIIKAAGFEIPADAEIQIKRNSPARRQVEKQLDPTLNNIETDPHDVLTIKGAPKVFILPGRPHIEKFFNEHVVDIIYNLDKYSALGIEFPSAIVLHGPPGCGKTYAVERLVEFLDWPSYSIDSNTIGSPYIHETSKKISEIFDKAIDSAPSVIVIDEMESFLSDRRSGGSSSMHHVEEVAEFLRRIPEAIKSKVMVIAMTNLIELIDPAILRRGRFDHIIEVGMPTKIEVSSLLNSLLSKLPTSDNLQLEGIIESLTGKALSDSAFVVREAARLAARSGKNQIDQECVDAALKSLPPGNDNKNSRIGFI